VAGNEEGCCTVRVCLSDLSEGKDGASETQWDPTALGDPGVEVG